MLNNTEYYHKQCTQADRQKGGHKTKGVETQSKQPLEYETSKPNEKHKMTKNRITFRLDDRRQSLQHILYTQLKPCWGG